MNRNLSGFERMITGNTAICLSLCLFALLGADSIRADVLAFPGAEGYGKYVTGGRGGVVYEVTNLNSSGTGSLGAAIGASGARTVVFRVSGTITGNFNIKNGNITIAGQSAPGDGICIKGTLGISADNVIVRYIRVRNDTSVNPESDALGGRGHQNIIIDHVSVSWSGDEVMSFYQNTNVTIQWCMITEACAKFIDGVNTGHQFGGIWGNNYGTYHHNLIAHNVSRNMRWASGCKYNDYRNNVIYNWDYASCYGGEAYQDATWNFSTINMVANYYKYGPATDSGVQDRIAEPSARTADDKGSWYVSDNYVHGYPAVTANNWLGMDGSNYISLSAPWPAMPINQQTPQDAYNAVLASVGCSKPNRDSVDSRIVNEVATGTATYGNNGILTYPSDVGGWPTLNSLPAPADGDHDGMPDSWETANGLNPSNAADRNYYTLSTDYTNLEVYLDSLVNVLDETAPAPDPMTWATEPYGTNPTSIAMVATTATDASGVEYMFTCTAGGGHDSGWQNSTSYTDTGLTMGITYSYQVKARDKSIAQNETGYSSVGSASPIADSTAPTPNPMTWATNPYAVNPSSIAMVATTAADSSGVEYYFTNLTDPNHDSGWQDSTSYTDTGLTTGSVYSYRVKARDKSVNQNETGWSAARAVTLVPDTAAPVPNPMTWASAPASIGIDTITMTVTTATDASGVEYYFACTSGGGHDSDWQDSTSYTDTGLTNNTIYTYRVMARDKSGDQNETGWSDQASATTFRYECLDPVENDFNGDCRVDLIDYAAIASVWGAQSGELVNLITNGDFATNLSGWNTSLTNPTLVEITWDSGTAKLARTISNSTGPNGNYLYQVIPVVSGKVYELDTQWKGDLTTTSTDRQWSEVLVGFSSTDTPASMGSIMYKKSTYGGVNIPTGPWDWESILLSPNTSPVPPAGGLFTATDNYMVVAFNIGGRANAGTCYYSVDNISLVEAGGTTCPTIDLNDDCQLDIQDLVIFAGAWLDCNRDPGSECLQ